MAEKQDRRGCPKGAGTVKSQPKKSGRPGLIGNPPYEPTDEKRKEIRTLAKVLSREGIAEQMGISIDTLRKYHNADVLAGEREAVAMVGGKVLNRALEGSIPDSFFYLRTRGRSHGWSSRVEHTGPGGGPIRTVDLTAFLEGKSEEELRGVEQALELLAAATSGPAGESGGNPAGAPPSEEPAPPAGT